MPEVFGLIAMASIMIVGLAMFSDIGLKPNVVQNVRGNEPSFLNTVWAIQIFQGVAIWLGALGIALLIWLANSFGLASSGTVYADARLPCVIAILSITALMGGFHSTNFYTASRHLAIARITQVEITAQIAGLLLMIVWVSFDRSIWALVAGTVCSGIVSLALGYAWLPGQINHWEWDRSVVREIVQFGKWIFISSILGFLVSNADRLLLGAIIDSTMLGVYVIAFLLFSSVEQALTRITDGVALPTFCEIARERPAELKRSYYRIHAVIASFAYFCSGALVISGQTLIGLLYDGRYEQAGWMLEALAVALLAAPFQIAIQCFVALGIPRILSQILAICLLTLFVVVPTGFQFFGLAGAVWGIVLSRLLCIPAILIYSARSGFFDLRAELLPVPMVIAGMGAAGIFSLVIKWLE